jgi:hypothetical protein
MDMEKSTSTGFRLVRNHSVFTFLYQMNLDPNSPTTMDACKRLGIDTKDIIKKYISSIL